MGMKTELVSFNNIEWSFYVVAKWNKLCFRLCLLCCIHSYLFLLRFLAFFGVEETVLSTELIQCTWQRMSPRHEEEGHNCRHFEQCHATSFHKMCVAETKPRFVVPANSMLEPHKRLYSYIWLCLPKWETAYTTRGVAVRNVFGKLYMLYSRSVSLYWGYL